MDSHYSRFHSPLRVIAPIIDRLGIDLWARFLGEALPTTHAMRIVRGMLLKGNGLTEILPDVWSIVLFMLVTVSVAVWFYRETLE
jgi:hypothetical protein